MVALFLHRWIRWVHARLSPNPTAGRREDMVKEDGSIAARNGIARLGKGELRTDAALREQVLDVLVVHRHLIPTARRGHYMMVVPHD